MRSMIDDQLTLTDLIAWGLVALLALLVIVLIAYVVLAASNIMMRGFLRGWRRDREQQPTDLIHPGQATPGAPKVHARLAHQPRS